MYKQRNKCAWEVFLWLGTSVPTVSNFYILACLPCPARRAHTQPQVIASKETRQRSTAQRQSSARRPLLSTSGASASTRYAAPSEAAQSCMAVAILRTAAVSRVLHGLPWLPLTPPLRRRATLQTAGSSYVAHGLLLGNAQLPWCASARTRRLLIRMAFPTASPAGSPPRHPAELPGRQAELCLL